MYFESLSGCVLVLVGATLWFLSFADVSWGQVGVTLVGVLYVCLFCFFRITFGEKLRGFISH